MANISFLLNQFPSGGVERVTMNLIPDLRAKGHRIFIFVHKSEESCYRYATIRYREQCQQI